DSCRICSGPGEPDQPLFYPCKCSGTIRYIHQDCLKTWLDHSKKTTCDVCKHPYVFTKVYAEDMPERVPVSIIIRKFAEQVVSAVLFMIRAILVAFVWLTLLPYGTLLTWRMYFRMGNILAWWISMHPRQVVKTTHPPTEGLPSQFDPRTVYVDYIATKLVMPYLRTLPADIFTGQIIASLIVLAFLAVFLLREWIQQNARPGVFDDAPVAVVEAPAVVDPQPRAEPPPVQPPALEIPAMIDADDDSDRDTLDDPDSPVGVHDRPLPDVPEDVHPAGPSSSSSSDTEGPNVPRDRPWARAAELRARLAAAQAARPIRRRRDSSDEENLEAERYGRHRSNVKHETRKASRSGLHALDGGPKGVRANGNSKHLRNVSASDSGEELTSKSKGKRRAHDSEIEIGSRDSSPSNSTRRSISPSPDFAFTFRTPHQMASGGSQKSTPAGSSSAVAAGKRPIRTLFELPPLDPSNRGNIQELPFPLTPRPSTSFTPAGSLVLPSQEASTSSHFTNPSQPATPSSSHSTLKRPQLPVSVAQNEQFIAEGSNVKPLLSPNLAIYQAPEELPIKDVEYFTEEGHAKADEQDQEDEEDEEDEDNRYGYYFNERREDRGEVAPPRVLHDTDDEDDEDDVAEPPRVVGGQPGEVPLVPPRAAEQDVEEEERDQNLEEDLDGVMEAIGLRGPIFAVFQNAALMFFILNVTIGGGVWLPFTLGKSVALLTLEPRRALQILHFPIRAVRLVTDPSVDSIIYGLTYAATALLTVLKSLFVWGASIAGISEMKAEQCILSVAEFFKSDFWNMSFLRHFVHKTVPTNVAKQTTSWTSLKNVCVSLSISEDPLFRLLEEAFAALGRHVRLIYTVAVKEWSALAEGDGTLERVLAVLLGYAIAAFLAALYLNTFTVGNVRSAGRAIRSAIRQQMVVLKVALFIVVELVMFPFGCGVMLDFNTLPLFPETSTETRLAFFIRAPVTAAFYHWLIGTMFMYQFAILLATCRELLRPGCMWFIKDPQDPTFHPIRDILDRPTLAQLRKLCMSAGMYAGVISLGVGGIVRILGLFTPPMLPLRWKMREPLSEIPVDLLFVHLILPPTLHYFRPRKPVRRLVTVWWQWTARQMRLTSFMFGGRHPNEETSVPWSWTSLLPRNKVDAEIAIPIQDGGFRRAPAGDNIAFLRDKPALVHVNEQGVPLTDTWNEILVAQDSAARQANRKPEDDYTIVYVPPNFRRRIIAFIFFFWLSGALALVSAIVVPIATGRAVFRLFSNREVHDGYSFIVGFYVVWWSWLVGTLFVKVRTRRQRHIRGRQASDMTDSDGRIRANWFLFLFKRVSVYFSKVLWMVFWLGFVLPTMVSIAVELYLVIPLRHFMDPEFTPTIHIFESWATGLIISKIIIRTHRPRPGDGAIGSLETIRRNGWRRPDPWSATRDFIIPATTGLAGAILIPPLLVYCCCKIFTIPYKAEDIHRLIYPSIFVVVACGQFCMSLTGVFAKWTQSIRDKEFLVELRLRNLDQTRNAEKPPPPPKGVGALVE
ncbi:hypothetical protein BU17DRAFT_48138, partial [Hysterangium stoloniferum]